MTATPCTRPDIGNPWISDGRCLRCGFMLAAHKVSRFTRWLVRTFGAVA